MEHPVIKPWESGILAVHENRRYLVNGKKPFLWLGDTAWLLFEKLDREQSQLYLKNRQAKGFNVIQATLVHTLPGAAPAGRDESGCALQDGDFARPNPEGGFWRHVDRVVDLAGELGLYMGLLPYWGSMVKQGRLTTDNAEAYGSFLAERYGKRANIIWIMGGDIRGSEGYEVWMKLARTIKRHCPDRLMGFHPFGRTSSSLWFNEAEWLDFNMFQSGHRRYDQASLGAWDDNAVKEAWFGEDNWKYAARDYAASVKRPTLDGEPSYEQIPQGLHDPGQPRWQDRDVRRYAYWSMLEGACGHTYGHNAVMQFHQEGDGVGNYSVNAYWHEAIHDPGSGQMGHFADLMRSVDFSGGSPAQQLLAGPQKEGYARISAFAGKSFSLFYSYLGEGFEVKLPATGWPSAQAWWFDPAAGVYSYQGDFQCDRTKRFSPPRKPSGHNDWVLLLRA